MSAMENNNDGGGNDEHVVDEEVGPMWASDGNDNYGGGDDNYPKRDVEMGVVERAEGRGWDRQK